VARKPRRLSDGAYLRRRSAPLACSDAAIYLVGLFTHTEGAQMNQPSKDKDLQGEGNYDATRRYNKATREFVEAGKVDPAAQAARPESPQQAENLERAEEAGKAHAKGEDPALRPQKNPTPTPKPTPK
jgi:hypothetical protein